MGQHLYKEGKRKCYKCKEIYPLSSEYFYKTKNKNPLLTFSYCCKKCDDKRTRVTNPQNKIRKELIIKAGNRCEKCKTYNEHFGFFDIDHIVSEEGRFKGKNSFYRKLTKKDEGNLQVLCPNCHRIKTIEDREKRNSFTKNIK